MKKMKLVLLAVGFLLLFVTAFQAQSFAGVNVSIGINIPLYRFGAPPPLVVIPGTYAYFAPQASVDILFYHGYWYRPYAGRWYRARGYNGPWVFIAPPRVPRVLVQLPPDYRRVYVGHPHIAYRDVHRNWQRWERERYWERNEMWREGAHHERRHEGREEGHGHGEHRGRY